MKRLAAALGLLLAALPIALLLGALLPRNAGWHEAQSGVTIFVDSSDVHTELILPVAAAGHDWRRVLPPEALRDGTTHLGFSWGERDFFLATPEWGDLRAGTALRALFASKDSLVHVYRLPAPSGRPLRLATAEYLRLASWLEREIAPGPPIAGYGADDIFLPGTSRYSWARTCNNWAADALAAAGVKVGRWTPLPQGLMWRFPAEDGESG